MSASSVLKMNSHKTSKKSAVYYYYRDMLENYNHKANKILENLPATMIVREDKGINNKIEMIIQKSKSNEWETQLSSAAKERNGNEMKGAPPRCIQNAMLTKDKKPFTYTPGGIDLSEIRSPNMARRLELNAKSEGTAPARDTRMSTVKNSPNYLPPSALAAMQPALPVQVLPKIATMKSQPSAPQINNRQSSYSENAVKINQPSYNYPPPAPPFPFAQTNVPSKLAPLKSEIHDQHEKPSTQKNVRFETDDRNINKKESGEEFKKCAIPQNLTPNSCASPVLLNLNKSPTPWVPKKYNDIREIKIPSCIEPKNLQEKTILSSVGNSMGKEKISIVKSEKNEHIIPVKIEGLSHGMNSDFQVNRKNSNYENTERTNTALNRIIPIEVEDNSRNHSYSPPMSPSGRCGTRRKIPSVNPIQSRSFRILQKITDSYEDVNNNSSNDVIGCNNVYNMTNIELPNTVERHNRSNTHSPALDMYEDKIRSQQEMNYGKAYKILHNRNDICDTYDQLKLDALLNNGTFHNLRTKTSTKQNNKNFNNLMLSVPDLKSKQNDGQVINIKHFDSNHTNYLIKNKPGVSETEAYNRMVATQKSNQKNPEKLHQKYDKGKTHSRLLHLVT